MKKILFITTALFSIYSYADEQSIQLVKEIAESTVPTNTPDYINISAFNQNP